MSRQVTIIESAPFIQPAFRQVVLLDEKQREHVKMVMPQMIVRVATEEEIAELHGPELPQDTKNEIEFYQKSGVDIKELL